MRETITIHHLRRMVPARRPFIFLLNTPLTEATERHKPGGWLLVAVIINFFRTGCIHQVGEISARAARTYPRKRAIAPMTGAD